MTARVQQLIVPNTQGRDRVRGIETLWVEAISGEKGSTSRMSKVFDGDMGKITVIYRSQPIAISISFDNGQETRLVLVELE